MDVDGDGWLRMSGWVVVLRKRSPLMRWCMIIWATVRGEG